MAKYQNHTDFSVHWPIMVKVTLWINWSGFNEGLQEPRKWIFLPVKAFKGVLTASTYKQWENLSGFNGRKYPPSTLPFWARPAAITIFQRINSENWGFLIDSFRAGCNLNRAMGPIASAVLVSNFVRIYRSSFLINYFFSHSCGAGKLLDISNCHLNVVVGSLSVFSCYNCTYNV